MALEMLIQEAQGMSEASIMEVVRFMRFIKREKSDAEPAKPVVRRAGKYRDQIVMSEDFDEPLKMC